MTTAQTSLLFAIGYVRLGGTSPPAAYPAASFTSGRELRASSDSKLNWGHWHCLQRPLYASGERLIWEVS